MRLFTLIVACSLPPGTSAGWLAGRDFVEKVKVVKAVAGPAGGYSG